MLKNLTFHISRYSMKSHYIPNMDVTLNCAHRFTIPSYFNLEWGMNTYVNLSSLVWKYQQRFAVMMALLEHSEYLRTLKLDRMVREQSTGVMWNNTEITYMPKYYKLVPSKVWFNKCT